MDLTAWQEAQEAVLGALILEPEKLAGKIFHRARAQYFRDSALRHLFEAALKLWETNRPIDPVTLASEAGAKDYSETVKTCMIRTPTTANTDAYLDILVSSARLSTLQSKALEIAGAETEQAALDAYDALGELLRQTEQVEDLSLGELIRDYLDRMQSTEKPDYLSWGIDVLDQTLNTAPGTFAVLAADSSVGKTALALQFAYHMAEAGKRVGFFSIETGKESLADRLMAERQVAGIRLPVTKARALTEYDYQRAVDAGIRSDGIQLRIIRRCESVRQIRARTIMHRFDVIFIDYVQLIDEQGGSRPEIVTTISMKLHRMAQQLGVTVVALSQITPVTKGSKAAPTKDDLRESRQLKHDADLILILSPSQNDADPANTRILDVAKNKDGRCPSLKLQFEPEFMTFSHVVPVDAMRSAGKAAKQQAAARSAKKRKAETAEASGSDTIAPLPEDEDEDIPF